jgi:hypothetical protein
LLARLRPGRQWPDDEVEILHRDASGNPRRLLRLAGPGVEALVDRADEDSRPAVQAPSSIGHHRVEEPGLADAVADPAPTGAPVALPMPLTGPTRPPIRFEENMIEVGWSAEDAASPGGRIEDSSPRLGGSTAEAGEEAVQDHYAALQAWREWSENQARRASRTLETSEDEPDDEIELEDDEDEPATAPRPRADRPTVRVEGEQKFAPFGQLFSRMAQAREPE